MRSLARRLDRLDAKLPPRMPLGDRIGAEVRRRITPEEWALVNGWTAASYDEQPPTPEQEAAFKRFSQLWEKVHKELTSADKCDRPHHIRSLK